MTNQEKEIFLDSIKKHIIYLMDNKNISFSNNHGLHQISSQLIISKNMMNYDSIYKESYAQVKKRLIKIIKNQFYLKDGIHKENSPTYQYNCVLALKSLMDEGYLNKKQIKLVNKIDENIYWLLLPNSHIANLGDSDYSLTLSDYKNPSDKLYKVFKEAGYFVVKTDKSYLIQHSGFGSKGHRHSDDFGFYWYDLDQNILMDTGKYAYVGKPNDINSEAQKQAYQNRKYAISSRAHNTLEFNDENNLISKNVYYKNAIKKVVFNKKYNYYIVKSKTKVRGVIFERTIYYSPEKYLIVQDKFDSNKKNLKTAKQWFHLAPDLTMKKEGEKYIIYLKNNNKITVSQLNQEAKADKLYYGDKEPRMQGWISMAYGKIEPNYAFDYVINDKQKGEFITIFRINDSEIPKNVMKALYSK